MGMATLIAGRCVSVTHKTSYIKPIIQWDYCILMIHTAKVIIYDVLPSNAYISSSLALTFIYETWIRVFTGSLIAQYEK